MSEPTPIAPHDLAAKLAARLCHDLIGPAGALVSGLDLLEDTSARDMHADAMALVISSGRSLAATLKFARIAYGSGNQALATSEFHALVTDLFDGHRATLDWAPADTELPGPAARALLNLAQIALGALAMGGRAHVQVLPRKPGLELVVTATDERVRLHPEIKRGLAGEGLVDGLAGRWVQARFLHAIVTAVGGELGVEVSPGVLRLWAQIPSHQRPG